MLNKIIFHVSATFQVLFRLVRILASKHDRDILEIKKLISEEAKKYINQKKLLDSLNELFYENRKSLEYLYFGYKDAKLFRTKMKKADDFLKRVYPLMELSILSDFSRFIEEFKSELKQEIMERASSARIIKSTEEQKKDIQFIPDKWELRTVYKQSINQS